MKLTRTNLSNIAIGAIAVILFSGFVFLATKGGDKDNNLATTAATSTTRRATTTTTEETTTSLLEVTSTTAAAAATSTTAKAVTTTTAKKTTPTTNAAGRPTGRNTVLTDNTGHLTHSATTCVVSSTAPSGAGADQLEFTLDFGPGKQNRSEHACSGNLPEFIVTLTNKSDKPIAFVGPNGEKDLAVVTVILRMSGASDTVFQISGGTQRALAPGESISLTQTNASVPDGTFAATASAEVDYG